MKRKPTRIAILGFGREGKAILSFLRRAKEYRGAVIETFDQKHGRGYLRNLKRFDIIFRSPGVPYALPELARARRAGVVFSSATKLFFERFRGTIVGITGSKGKGTAATLLYRMLRRAGYKTFLGGNIGVPAINFLRRASKKHIAVLELSSFQLQDLRQSPHIAVVLDVFPEHLDVHKNAREYFAAKARICRFQKQSDAVFYFSDNVRSAGIARKSRGRKIGIRAVSAPLRNTSMAAAVARYLGVEQPIIAGVLKSFRGLPHRLEFVRSLRIEPRNLADRLADQRRKSVRFYNDSAATNPHATAFALAHFKEPLVLIAGGKDKGLDYAPLVRAIRRARNVKAIILIGKNRKKIHAALSGITNYKLQITEANTLFSATKAAYRFAKIHAAGGSGAHPVVLFSPAAASFDMFRDYADRGDKFKRIVRTL